MGEKMFLDIIDQLSRNPHYKISGVNGPKVCTCKGCTNPRHTSKNGNPLKVCRECMNRRSRESRLKRVQKNNKEKL